MYSSVSKKKRKILWVVAYDGWGYYKMILLLLFSISSTIRANIAQNPNYEYSVVRMRENSRAHEM